MNKLNDISFAEERILRTVTIERDSNNSLGMQITEGSDGRVYVQSVIVGGPAHSSNSIFSGDQIIAVNGQNLLSLNYETALAVLKNTGQKVQFIVSHSNISQCDTQDGTQNEHADSTSTNASVVTTVEKYLTESCYDASNSQKYIKTDEAAPPEVPYHKHIRYEIEPEHDEIMFKKNIPSQCQTGTNLNKSISKSCAQIDSEGKVKIVGMIPKKQCLSWDRKQAKNAEDKDVAGPIALPRSLGLSRKWRGPVRYPVTPVKKDFVQNTESDNSCFSNSEDEQVFF